MRSVGCHHITFIFLYAVFRMVALIPYVKEARKESVEWFQGGPNVEGGNNCQKCSGFCVGHFLSPTEALAYSSSPMNPPSAKQYTDRSGKANSSSHLYLVLLKLLKPDEQETYRSGVCDAV